METKDFEYNFWVFKTVPDEVRSYQSIEGYDDDFSSRYEYDNNVANHLQVKPNDVATIIDKENILGFAKIAEIAIAPGTKQIKRCPECGSTNYEERKTKLPRYRCNRGHDFSEPISEVQEVTKFSSVYGDSFIEMRRPAPISILRPYYANNYNRNMSIQKLDRAFFDANFPDIPELLTSNRRHYINPNEGEPEHDPYTPNNEDERDSAQREIKARRGQTKFRKELRKRYHHCVVTGCAIWDILEAAHINPYKGEKDNHPSNGLLLRSDIHTMFDLDLIGIDPETLEIHLSDKVRNSEYKDLHLQPLKLINTEHKPNKAALQIRWNEFKKPF